MASISNDQEQISNKELSDESVNSPIKPEHYDQLFNLLENPDNADSCPDMAGVLTCIDDMELFLYTKKIDEVLSCDPNAYIGGSVPSYMIANYLSNYNIKFESNDIDIYTSNYPNTLYLLSAQLGDQISFPKNNGLNITFGLGTNIKIQIMTPSFDSFVDDVLGTYDSDMVRVGYYPYKKRFIIHDLFKAGLRNKLFQCIRSHSQERRLEKLERRTKEWYRANFELVGDLDRDFRPYWKKGKHIKYIQDIPTPPPYIQSYMDLYSCVRCNKKTITLICNDCKELVSSRFDAIIKPQSTRKSDVVGSMTVIGGVNGFGQILNKVASASGYHTIATSRNPPPNRSKFEQFKLGKDISAGLKRHLATSRIIVLNAYSTLEGDHSIWTRTLDNFNFDLAKEKFTTNTLGYVKFLQEFVNLRKSHVNRAKKVEPITLVWMDANESKFENKLPDGKHLELNLAKTATKQIFYTNSNLLASVGVEVICYDPGWMSYHGISVQKIESKSDKLIPPELSAEALLYFLAMDSSNDSTDGKNVRDVSVYDVIKSVK